MSLLDVVAMTFDTESSQDLTASASMKDQVSIGSCLTKGSVPGPSEDPKKLAAIQARRAELERKTPDSKKVLAQWIIKILLLDLSALLIHGMCKQVSPADIARVLQTRWIFRNQSPGPRFPGDQLVPSYLC